MNKFYIINQIYIDYCEGETNDENMGDLWQVMGRVSIHMQLQDQGKM